MACFCKVAVNLVIFSGIGVHAEFADLIVVSRHSNLWNSGMASIGIRKT